MKKILLLLAGIGMTGISAMSQDIQMYMGDELIDAGRHVFNDIDVTEQDDLFYVEMNPHLSLLCAQDVNNVKVNADCKSGINIQLCTDPDTKDGNAGTCEMGKNVTKSGIKLYANEKLPLDFEITNYFEEVPEAVVTDITVEVEGVPATKKVYTIVMNDKNEGGVNVIAQDRTAFATPNAIYYSVSGNTAVSVYDMNGRRVLSSNVAGSGSIDLSNLAGGMYIYRFNGASNISGKVLVK